MEHPKITADAAAAEETVAGYEAPRVESVLSPEEMEREALYGGTVTMN